MPRLQHGSVLTLVLLGLLGASVLATIAYGSYYQIARGTQDTINRANSSALLTQAAYALLMESRDVDADGIAEPPAGGVALGDGWAVPAKADAWGSAIKYCPWDNSSLNPATTSSTNRLPGTYPAQATTVQLALVSAGADKAFSTSCTQALAGALGDDGVRTITLAQQNQGVGGTYFYGDPVANDAALPTANIPIGMLRLNLETQVPLVWDGTNWSPLSAGAWLEVVADEDCSPPYPVGTLGHDTSDNLYMCAATTKKWKKVSN